VYIIFYRNFFYLVCSCIIRMLLRKQCPTFFFLVNYLFRMYEIHGQCNWMFPLHTLFFHIISIYVYSLMPVWNKGMHAFPVPARFPFTQPCPHCANHTLVIFKSCPMQCILQWPKKMKKLQRQFRAIGRIGEHSPTKFGDCLLVRRLGWGRALSCWINMSPGFLLGRTHR